MNELLTAELVASMVMYKPGSGHVYKPSITEIMQACADAVGESLDKLMLYAGCRKREYTTFRQLVCYYATFHTNLTLNEIAVNISGKYRKRVFDHTTICDSREVIKRLAQGGNDEILNLMEAIEKRL